MIFSYFFTDWAYMPIIRMMYTTSVFFTGTVTLDRYLKIKYGLHYNRLFTTSRLVKLIIFIWCTAVVVSLLALLPSFVGVPKDLAKRIEIITHCFLAIGRIKNIHYNLNASV